MTQQSTPHPASSNLLSADAALEKLDRLCCDPGRSPRMRELAATIDKARNAVTQDPDFAVGLLEAAGAQVGSLQVGCCTDARMPLYVELLDNLAKAQLSINRERGQRH